VANSENIKINTIGIEVQELWILLLSTLASEYHGTFRFID
jgi:hypothetical protein